MAGPGGKTVGRLNLKVLPDTSKFGMELRAFVKKIESRVIVRIPVEINDRAAYKEMAELRRIVDGLTPEVEVPVKVDKKSEFDSAMSKLRADLAAMRGGIGVPLRPNLAALAPVKLRAKLAGIAVGLAMTADVRMNLTRTSVVRAQFLAFLAGLRVLGRRFGPQVAVGVSGIRAARAGLVLMASKLADMSQKGSYVGRIIALWAPLIFVAASAVAAIGPALAALVPLFGGIALAVGAIALGWKQIVPLMAPIKKAFAGMRKEIGRTLTEGLKPMINAFARDFLPLLRGGFTQVARLLNAAAKNLLGFLNSGTGLSLMKQAMDGISRAMAPLTGLLAPLSEVFLRLAIAAAPALEIMNRAIVRVTENFAKWLAAGDKSGAITDSMKMLGDILSILGGLIRELFTPLFTAAPAAVAALEGVADVFGTVMTALTPVFEYMSENPKVVKILAASLAGLAIAVGVVVAALAVAGLVVSSSAAAIGAAIGAVIGAVIALYSEYEGFRNVVNFVFTVLVNWWKFLWNAAVWAVKGIIATVKFLAAVLVFQFKVITFPFRTFIRTVRWVYGLFNRDTSNAEKNTRSKFSLIKAIVLAAVAPFGIFKVLAIANLAGMLGYVKGIPGKIRNYLVGKFYSMLTPEGREMVKGFIAGIRSMAAGAKKAALDVVRGAKTAVRIFLAISSPSRVFKTIGRQTIEGMIVGIEGEKKALVAATKDVVSGAVTAASIGIPEMKVGVAADMTGSGVFSGSFDGGLFGDGGMELVIRNFESGRGWMREVTDTRIAQSEASNIRDARVGVGA